MGSIEVLPEWGNIGAIVANRGRRAMISEILTTPDLEKKTGLPRSTIYFYQRRGLLPEPQKKPGGHALYSEDHVALLLKIRDLKAQGASLPDIRRELKDEIAALRDSRVDLVEQQTESLRKAILDVAAEEFSSNGYKQTSVSTIIDKLGINEHDFYRLFPSKFELLVESFRARLQEEYGSPADDKRPRDFGEKFLRRLASDSDVHDLGVVFSAAAHTESLPHGFSSNRLVKAWAPIIGAIMRDLDAAQLDDSRTLPISKELLAYGIMGARRNVTTRASWDDTYHPADVMRVELFIVLAVHAALNDPVVFSRLAGYEDLIQELVAGLDRVPEPFEL